MTVFRTGTALRQDLLNLENTREEIVSEFLFARDVMSINAASGLGKTLYP